MRSFRLGNWDKRAKQYFQNKRRDLDALSLDTHRYKSGRVTEVGKLPGDMKLSRRFDRPPRNDMTMIPSKMLLIPVDIYNLVTCIY